MQWLQAVIESRVLVVVLGARRDGPILPAHLLSMALSYE